MYRLCATVRTVCVTESVVTAHANQHILVNAYADYLVYQFVLLYFWYVASCCAVNLRFADTQFNQNRYLYKIENFLIFWASLCRFCLSTAWVYAWDCCTYFLSFAVIDVELKFQSQVAVHHLEDIDIDGRIILKWIPRTCDREASTGVIWLRLGRRGGVLWMLRVP
jgi:hypothetical protein